MLPNTSKTPEFKKLHNLPKGVEFAILSKRFNEVRSAAQRIEMLMPTPVAPKSDDAMAAAARQSISAIHDEMQREIVGNPLFQAAQQPEVRNQGEFTRAA
jgi:hypothetical protein